MRRITALCFVLILQFTAPSLAKDLLIPLDDRPANLLFTEQLARVGSPQTPLQVPPKYLLGRLYTPGDSDALIEWADQQLVAGDTLFVSVDMWLYGGLVASRTAAIDNETVEKRLQRLQDIGGRGVVVHALATVPRLSLRTSDAQAPHEPKLRKWAKKSDLPSAKELLESARSGEKLPFPTGVPTEYVLEYLGVRERNVTTILSLIELAELGYLDSLVIGQDDSNKTGLHRFEQERIVAQISVCKVNGEVTLLSGIDELTMNLITGVWSKRAGVHPTVRVVYSEPKAAEKIPPLESLPLKAMIEQHVLLSGATVLQSEEADLDLYVYVPYSKPWNVPGEERRPASESFVGQVARAMDSGRQIAVADLSLVNRMDPFLAQESLRILRLYDLEGFASWNTPANTIGTVVSQAVAHQIAEKSPSWSLAERLESEKTHQAFLLARLIDDYAYQTVVRADAKKRVKGLSAKSDPLLNQFGPVGLDIRSSLIQWTNQIFQDYYLGERFLLQPQGTQVEFRRSKLEVRLPWPRVFEVEARLDLRLGLVGN